MDSAVNWCLVGSMVPTMFDVHICSSSDQEILVYSPSGVHIYMQLSCCYTQCRSWDQPHFYFYLQSPPFSITCNLSPCITLILGEYSNFLNRYRLDIVHNTDNLYKTVQLHSYSTAPAVSWSIRIAIFIPQDVSSPARRALHKLLVFKF